MVFLKAETQNLQHRKSFSKNEYTPELSPNLTATPHEVGLSAKQLKRISTTSQKFIDEKRLSGAVTVVARYGKVAHFQAFGMMDIEADKPMQRDTIFRIYSMTKPIAAAAVMMLCEEGKLQLDVPASSVPTRIRWAESSSKMQMENHSHWLKQIGT